MITIKYQNADVDGFNIFYREAGSPDAPKLLLLHGFPSASHMFRDLIPLLADRFHIIAPDLPGFGKSDMPERGCTFDRIADTIDRFTEVVGFDRYAVYVFDYGAPTGFRLALKHPDRITAIISQNGNAYEEGLSDGWNPIRAYWEEASPANREALRAFLKPEMTIWQYTHGVPDATAISPVFCAARPINCIDQSGTRLRVSSSSRAISKVSLTLNNRVGVSEQKCPPGPSRSTASRTATR